MKILVLQLARLGDILQSWPTLRALRRLQPEAEIHLLVRPRFKDATERISEVNAIWLWPTEEIFYGALGLEEGDPLVAAEGKLNDIMEQLEEGRFTHVINLSFSPLASWISYALALRGAKVAGYCRFGDGHLEIPDDASAYFYAQVGPGRPNRLHLSQIFAGVAGVTLCPEDLKVQDFVGDKSSYGVVHMGASELHKRWPVYKWRATLKKLESELDLNWFLVGGREDEDLAREVLQSGDLHRTSSLVGQKRFSSLFDLLGGARVLLGGDSAPMQVASLVGCPVINISFGTVNFWETGPLSSRSRVIVAPDPERLPSDRVVDEVLRFFSGKESGRDVFVRSEGDGPAYQSPVLTECDQFEWRLINAIYLGGDWPPCRDAKSIEGFIRLSQVANLILDQIEQIKVNQRNTSAAKLLEQSDILIEQIGKLAPGVSSVIRWMNTERSRIGPGAITEVLAQTEKVFRDFALVVNLYAYGSENDQNRGDVDGYELDR